MLELDGNLEYYYEDEARIPWTDEDMKEYLEGGSLNSRETDRAFRLRDEMRDMERSKLKI